jgi:hypothetical protein
MEHAAPESGESNNYKGRPYGTVLRTKNYPGFTQSCARLKT